MRLCGLCMRLCILRMRLCKGYTDKKKRKMKTCDSHVDEEVKFVTASGRIGMVAFSVYYWVLGELVLY